MRSFKALVIFFSTFAFALSACETGTNTNINSGSAPTPAPTKEITNVTPPLDEIASGRVLYTDNCAVCHKENGTGGEMEIEGRKIDPDDLTSDKIKAFSDDKIYGYIANGLPDEGMPAFKDKLSEAEIKSVIRYVRSDIQNLVPATNPSPLE